MNKDILKKALGYILLGLLLPLLLGFSTIDGEFCYHGQCATVVPFWGGFIDGFYLDVTCVLIILFFRLIIYLIT